MENDSISKQCFSKIIYRTKNRVGVEPNCRADIPVFFRHHLFLCSVRGRGDNLFKQFAIWPEALPPPTLNPLRGAAARRAKSLQARLFTG